MILDYDEALRQVAHELEMSAGVESIRSDQGLARAQVHATRALALVSLAALSWGQVQTAELRNALEGPPSAYGQPGVSG